MKLASVLAGILVLAVASNEGRVAVLHVFPGPDGPNPSDAPTVSADMMGGVSPKFLVGFNNGGISVLAKTDGRSMRPHQTLRQFWEAAFKNAGGELPGGPYDPRIFFDPLSSRWFAICDAWGPPPESDFEDRPGPTRHMLIGVSSDDDPTHPWKAVAFQAPGPVDNIKLALDKHGIYSAAAYGRTRPTVAAVAIPKADLLWRGEARPSLAHVNRLEVDGLERLGDHKLRGIEGMMPAFDLNPDKKLGDPVIFVNRYRTEVDGETIMQIRALSWTSATKAQLSEPTNIGLGTRYPVQPTTRGAQPPLQEGLFAPGLAAGEGRVVNAVVRGGSVWAIAATQINNRVGAFWVQIDLRASKLVQHGTLADPEADILFPSLNVDARGNLGVAMIRTLAAQGASTYVTGRLRTDPPNTLRPLLKVVEGRYAFFNKNTDLTKPGQGVPTSDYTTTVVDPSDSTLFWSYQMAATNDCTPKDANAGKYGTNWVAFRVEDSAGGRIR